MQLEVSSNKAAYLQRDRLHTNSNWIINEVQSLKTQTTVTETHFCSLKK